MSFILQTGKHVLRKKNYEIFLVLEVQNMKKMESCMMGYTTVRPTVSEICARACVCVCVCVCTCACVQGRLQTIFDYKKIYLYDMIYIYIYIYI
jgi:hypothetical protein